MMMMMMMIKVICSGISTFFYSAVFVHCVSVESHSAIIRSRTCTLCTHSRYSLNSIEYLYREKDRPGASEGVERASIHEYNRESKMAKS